MIEVFLMSSYFIKLAAFAILFLDLKYCLPIVMRFQTDWCVFEESLHFLNNYKEHPFLSLKYFEHI